jgi:hypothetical protein
MPTVPDPFSNIKQQTANVALTQLAADLLAIVAKGEKSVSFIGLLSCFKAEIIRKVLFELPNLQAYHLF